MKLLLLHFITLLHTLKLDSEYLYVSWSGLGARLNDKKAGGTFGKKGMLDGTVASDGFRELSYNLGSWNPAWAT